MPRDKVFEGAFTFIKIIPGCQIIDVMPKDLEDLRIFQGPSRIISCGQRRGGVDRKSGMTSRGEMLKRWRKSASRWAMCA
jgi:hypothetical protein